MRVAKSKKNCATCIHGFQWGYQTYSECDFNCHLDNSKRSSFNFIKCDKWLKRTVGNAKKFKGVFYMDVEEKFMDDQWRRIGKEHGWL